MTAPKVTLVQLDGALGVVPNTLGLPIPIVGPCDAGPIATPLAYGRKQDVISNYGAGPLVEWAAYVIDRYGRAVIPVRTTSTTAGSFGTINTTGVAGASVVTKHSGATCNDDYEAGFVVGIGGTVGVAGITYQTTLDGFRTLSTPLSLGTAVTLTIANSGGVQFDLTAATLLAGDKVSITCIAPNGAAADYTTALTALKQSTQPFGRSLIAGVIDASIFDAIEGAFSSMQGAGKWRAWIGNARLPLDGESEATYKTSVGGVFSSKATTVGSLYYGAAQIASSVSGRQYRRPFGLGAGARQASVSEEVNIADINLGPLPAVTITDINGNQKHHNEAVNPGADDLFFGTATTQEGYGNGVYVTRPRIFSAAGSDFTIMPYRDVMNLYMETLLAYLKRRLNKPVRVSKKTGLIFEADAREIEKGALTLLRAALTAKPKASDVQFAVSRTDLLLSTKTLTGDGGIIPLAYPEFINVSVGFVNPALQLIAA